MATSLSPDLEKLIALQAHSLGFATIEDYLRVVVGTSAITSEMQPSGGEVLSDVLNELGTEESLPTLPPGFSRADIYGDHA